MHVFLDIMDDVVARSVSLQQNDEAPAVSVGVQERFFLIFKTPF
jgi:hypothetical protein